MNRTLLDRAGSILSNANLSIDFLAEAISIALLGESFFVIVIRCKTLKDIWFGNPTNYFILRVFGCPAYAHVNDEKLEPQAKKCIFFNYASWTKGNRLFYPNIESPKFMISRDVIFDESIMFT